ncbi:hypothetical protein [Fructobacillus durionis]|uniref:hypothetical protein n=1 Tax=Fructobacillus durionis TaxID=283737 RepID=UPI003621F7E4
MKEYLKKNFLFYVINAILFYVIAIFVFKLFDFGLVKNLLSAVAYVVLSFLAGYYFDKQSHKGSHEG